MNYYRNFRMIELIILILILIILAILTVPMMFHAGEKAKNQLRPFLIASQGVVELCHSVASAII